jgi:cytochrome P450
MRRRCPVAYSQELGWSIFRHADVKRVLEDHESFSNAVSEHLSVPNGMDPPEHTIYRQMIEAYFSLDRVRAFTPTCRGISDQLISEAVRATGAVEVVSELATRFAGRVQCAFLGWPEDLHHTLIDWTQRNTMASRDGDREQLSRLANEFEAIVDKQLDQRADESTTHSADVTRMLMSERVYERPLSHEEISSILRNWTVGEIGTISASIGILLHHLALHPEDQRFLRDNPARLSGAIDEMLRVHNPLFSNRRVTRCPVNLGGHDIGPGERVTLHWISANRDEEVFEDASEVRFDRNLEQNAENLLYGAGVHVCPGAPLARMELEVFLESLLSQTSSWSLREGAVPVYASYPACGFEDLEVIFRS